MHAELTPEALLTLWECSFGQPAELRSEALLRASLNGADPVRTLGERNARLLELHARLFGRELELLSRCPACGTAAQFNADCEALGAQAWATPDQPALHRLEAQGHVIEFRLPAGGDVAIASGGENGDFARCLLDRCVLRCTHDGGDVRVGELPAPLLDVLSQRMEALDPGASVSFGLECPDCAARWQAPLDIGEVVWQKVRAAAERLFLEIDLLARAYGWTEREVLRLSPLRRAAYLQLAAA